MTYDKNALEEALKKACKKIAPLWPLENFVAVNPYLGRIDQPFELAAHELHLTSGIQSTLPVSFYMTKLKEGFITEDDIKHVLEEKNHPDRQNIRQFIANAHALTDEKEATAICPTVADIAAKISGKDWNRFLSTRISTWAASYFDTGQAIWKSTCEEKGIFANWRLETSIDLTAEISGLKNTRNITKAMPKDSLEAAAYALNLLKIPKGILPAYLHRLLMKLGGWSAHAARLDWDNEMRGEKSHHLLEFLVVLLSWECVIFQSMNSEELEQYWKNSLAQYTEKLKKPKSSPELVILLILQEAFENASQKKIIEKINKRKEKKKKDTHQKKAQAIFCIDVRSEVYRRNLELVNPDIETMGFAGFFAFPIAHQPLGNHHGDAQCPVLLQPGFNIKEHIKDGSEHETTSNRREVAVHLQKIWKTFRSGAVTCFSYVSPVGIFYMFKLFSDSWGMTRPVQNPETIGMNESHIRAKTVDLETKTVDGITYGIALNDRVILAKNALKAMSLTEGFAKMVLIVGHGSSSVNNPHASGLDCGACGGRSGEPNAKVAAEVLNDPEVRKQLPQHGINIPEETVFLACLHNTTTDEITIFNEQVVAPARISELHELKNSLATAGKACRMERSLRMNVASASVVDKSILERSIDWSQVRPEWGLAGCSAFVIAPRERTHHVNMEGKSFLHSYDWRKDDGFSVLELIMTAPMVVASWISLQYYGSTVDQKHFGSGNKTLHNITSGIGVIEGYAGDLRTGLPWQSIHDGKSYQHEPVRLNVIIEAPISAINKIITKHEMVRNLCDNEWIHLLTMNDEGQVAYRYAGDLSWEEVKAEKNVPAV